MVKATDISLWVHKLKIAWLVSLKFSIITDTLFKPGIINTDYCSQYK